MVLYWFIKNFFLVPYLSLVSSHKFKNGEALTLMITMASNNCFYARKKAGKKGKAPNHESKKKMGIPSHFEFITAEIGIVVPPPYAKFIGERIIESIKKGKA